MVDSKTWFLILNLEFEILNMKPRTSNLEP